MPKSSSSPSPSAVSAPTSSKSFSRAARSSRASENSPSSMPSPTYQWTKARLAYMRSNLGSTRVVLGWRSRGLNPGLSACKADALPLSYTPAQFRRDSNPQPPDSKSDTLSIAPRNFRTRATDDRGRLVVDAALEARRAPVDELDRALGLDRGDRGVDVLGDDVAAVHEAAGHVL